VVFAKALQVPVSEFSPTLADQLEKMRDVPMSSHDLESGATPSAHAETPLPDGSDEPELDGSYAYIPQYDAKAAAGLGSENPHVEIRSTLAFKRNWLRSKGVKPEHLIVIYADGQSMQPTINDQDVLLVDRSKVDPVDRSVFVLSSAEGAIVKRLIQSPIGTWTLRSDNEDKAEHPDRYFLRSDGNEHRIIGQVIWRGGDL
jgi:phage repressor protein C with HTH and peptisase S24 domain